MEQVFERSILKPDWSQRGDSVLHALILAGMLAFPFATSSATFTVATTADAAADLHQAIVDANANPGPDTIAFNLTGGTGVYTFAPTSALPTITDPLTLDGYTQAGASPNTLSNGNNAVLRIQLSGSIAGAANGLTVATSNCIVRGLIINGFGRAGILVQASIGNTIEGNFIGTGSSGTTAQRNVGGGVAIDNARNTLIGGASPASRNVISGNSSAGVLITGTNATANVIQGNIIGLGANGTTGLGNASHGVHITDGARGNRIQNNLISRNLYGVTISSFLFGPTYQWRVEDGGNGHAYATIGRMSWSNAEASAVSLGGHLVAINSQAEQNFINGTILTGPNATRTLWIGLNDVALEGTYQWTTGEPVAYTNWNAGQPNNSVNQDYGYINFYPTNRGSWFDGSQTSDFAIVEIELSTAALSNWITRDNVTVGNMIGTDLSGTLDRGNTNHGIWISAGSGNRIGGGLPGDGNIIAFNRGQGVLVTAGPGSNPILGNSLFSNVGLGIDLGSDIGFTNGVIGSADGLTANDPGDGDTGANGLQNFPVLTSVLDGVETTVIGAFDGAPTTTFRFEFFSQATADPSGYGEGGRFLGSIDVTTDAGGHAPFRALVPAVPLGQFVSATATDPAGNTSEFSRAVPVVDGPFISRQPLNATVLLGDKAVFTGTAEGAAPLRYQWLKNGNPIAGAATNTFLLRDVQFGDAGAYQMVASNAFAAVTSMVATLVVRSPSGGDVDFSFDVGSSINGNVRSMAVQPDGKVVIGGSFTTVNGAARAGIARLNPDGSTDEAFMSGLNGGDGTIESVVLQGDGKILIAGQFSAVNDVVRGNVARLNSDGTLDAGFLNGLSGANGAVHALAVQTNGGVILGGDFTSVNDLSRNRIARLNPDGSVDTNFLSGLPGANRGVRTVVALLNGDVLVGGRFTNINGVARNGIARLNSDGTLDTGFADVLGWTAIVDMAVTSGGLVVVAGYVAGIDFSSARMARLNANGSLDSSFQQPPFSSQFFGFSSVEAIAWQSDGKVLVGGFFNEINGVGRGRIARLNSNGTLDTSFQNSMSGANALVESVVLSGTNVFIGGAFTTVNDIIRHRIARLNTNGTLNTNFSNGAGGLDSAALSLALQGDDSILIGGTFDHVQGAPRHRIVRLEPSGTLDGTFLNGLIGANDQVNSIAIVIDLGPLVGGNFTNINGLPRGRVAQLNWGGSLYPLFLNGLAGANERVETVVVKNDNVLIGGFFTNVNGVVRNRIARLNSDGSVDTRFQSGLSGANDGVQCALEQDDGKILIGGSFTMVNGVPRNRVARLEMDGSLDESFLNSLQGPNSTVTSLSLQNDGKVLIGGLFTSVHGVPRGYIARLNTDGSLDEDFLGGMSGADSEVRSVLAQSDGKALLAGTFTTVNGVSRGHIARLNWDGSLDESFQSGLSGANGDINAVAVQSDGRIVIAGDFTMVNGAPADRVARLQNGPPGAPYITDPPPSQMVVAGSTLDLSVAASGTLPMSYQWLFEGIALASANTPDLTLPSVDSSDAGSYQVVVSNAVGVVTSAVAVVTVLLPPTITLQPLSQTVLAGSDVVLTVEAAGTLPMGFFWLSNGAVFASTTLNESVASLTLRNVQPSSAADYRVVITNIATCAGVTSIVATLRVLQPPGVTGPVDTNVIEGGLVVFCAAATGSPPFQYQWRQNGANIPGETNACLILTNVQLRQGGSYSVAVANPADVTESTPPAVLVVKPRDVIPVQPADLFANRGSLAGSNGLVVGTNRPSTREFCEPFHAGKRCSNSVWYTWRAPATGIATFDTIGATFDTLLAVYTGSVVSDLTPIVADEDRGGFFTSKVQFNAVKDVDYQIAIDGYAGQTGAFSFRWDLETTSEKMPVIDQQPSSQTVTPGSVATFHVVATGASLNYQWYFNNTLRMDGKTNSTLILTNVQMPNIGFYSVAITNADARGVVSLPASLELGSRPGPVTVAKPDDFFLQNPGNPCGAIRLMSGGGEGPPSYSVVAGEIAWHGWGNQSGQTPPKDACTEILSNPRWLLLTAESGGTLMIDAKTSSIPTVVAVSEFVGIRSFIGCVVTTNVTAVERLRFDATKATQYLVQSDGYKGETGELQLNWVLGYKPELSNRHTNLVVPRGGIQPLIAITNDALPRPSFQWWLGGQAIVDATNSTLVIRNMDQTKEGLYRVVASNALGVATSDVATVVITRQWRTLGSNSFTSTKEDWGFAPRQGFQSTPDPRTFDFNAVSGNPPGCLLVRNDAENARKWYWHAPLATRANLAFAYGGWLEFEIRDSSPGLLQPNWPLVEMTGDGLTLVYFELLNSRLPFDTWTKYRVPLRETAPFGEGVWFKNAWGGLPPPIGSVPTREEMLRVMENLTDLRIRGQATAGFQGRLDNVSVNLTCYENPQLSIRLQDTNSAVLSWPFTGYCYRLAASHSLDAPFWHTNFAVISAFRSNGANQVVVPTPGPNRFFRLFGPEEQLGGCADNVRLTIATLADGRLQLSWPAASGCYQLTASDSLQPGSWTTPVVNITTSNGTNYVVEPASGRTRFFRLTRPQ